MFLSLRVSAIATLVALLLPCTLASQVDSSSGRIRGRVQASGNPVVDIPVVLQPGARETRTDAGGRFVFSGLAAGRYRLLVSDSTGAAHHRDVTVSAGMVADVVIDLASSAPVLSTVVVRAVHPLHVLGHLPELSDNVLYAGKKTEVVEIDSLRANIAVDVERQILGRIPGAHFSETSRAGFPSNGVGFRGLDPTQSVELNTRQNGANLSADVYGYPETYYTPPTEALERIEVVRGAGSLAYGPQFGGAINYVIRRGTPNSAPSITSAQSTGSFGLFNSFNAIGGGSGALTYYAFAHYRTENGWRPNSDYRQATLHGSLTYVTSPRLTVGAEYSLHRNRIHMPGGLSDEQFSADPRASCRARNWLESPWNLLSVRADATLSRTVSLRTLVSWSSSGRALVWRNEDGGAAAPDTADASGSFVEREVEKETFNNLTVESRLASRHSVLGAPAVLTVGARAFRGTLRRFEGGPGSTGSDFDLHLVGGDWERALRFETTSSALFAEELLRAGPRLSITPGVRIEQVSSRPHGYTDVDSVFVPRSYRIPLGGIAAEYVTSSSTQLYANVAQAYRPLLYGALVPFGSVARVSSSLRDSRGYNADLGWRGMIGQSVKFDASLFQLSYRRRVGVAERTSDSGSYLETTNTGSSRHRGVEAYVELDALQSRASQHRASLDFFTSFAYVDARYVAGEFAGRRVEQAPRVLLRSGMNGGIGPVSSTLQWSHTGDSFGDATNSRVPSEDGAVGYVPSYELLDWSIRVAPTGRFQLDAGVNNVMNRRYFTKRTGEYPGPGILPGLGRAVYAGVRARI